MKRFFLFAAAAVCMVLAGCNGQQGHTPSSVAQVSEPADTVVPVVEVPFREKLLTAADVTLTKDLLYDTYTLEDTYPYKDTVRSFKWDVIRNCLAYIENMQRDSVKWVVLQNYKNLNREAPLVRKFVRNAYRRVADTLGVSVISPFPCICREIRWCPNVMAGMGRWLTCWVRKAVSAVFSPLRWRMSGWFPAVI